MSGTSCDGTDAAVIGLRGRRVRVLGSAHAAYAPALRAELLRLASGVPAPAAAFARAGESIAAHAVRSVRAAARRARVPLRRIAAVGVHGHTLFHGPRDPQGAVTWQAGNWSRIAEELGVTVVADFRPRDVAAGSRRRP